MNIWLRNLAIFLTALALVACSSDKKSSKSSSEKTEEPTEKNPDEEGKDNTEKPDGPNAKFGTDPGEDDFKHASKTAGSVTPASPGIHSPRPGNSWAMEPTNDGHFFLAATATARTVGGDMIRRIDLDGTIQEFDFDPNTGGTQGFYLEVPSSQRGAFAKKDFSGDGLFQGVICGFAPGPKGKVFALAEHGAFLFDAHHEKPSIVPDVVIALPHAANACNGVYVEEFNRLYVVEVSRVGSSRGQKGVFVAEIPSETGVATNGSLYGLPQDYGFNNLSRKLFNDLDIFDSHLYLVEGAARFDGEWDTGIHKVPLNENGEPLWEKATQVRGDNPISERAQGCTANPDNTAGIMVTETGGKPVLLAGGTSGITAWDISGEGFEKMDLEPKPGIQPLDLAPYGQGAPEFKFGIGTNDVFAMPHCRSASKKIELGGGFGQAFALSLVRFDLSGEKPFPAGEVEVSFASWAKEMLEEVKPAYRPNFNMALRDLAIGPKYGLVVGAGKSGQTGLGAASDVIILDLEKGSGIAFAEVDAIAAHKVNYGFKLAQDDPNFEDVEQTVHAAQWLPAK